MMELKPPLLFPCCASLTHVRLVSLIRENKCLRLPTCNSILCVRARVSACSVCERAPVSVWEAISLDSPLYNLSLLAQNAAWTGRSANCSWSESGEHLARLTEVWTADEQRGKIIDYLINSQIIACKQGRITTGGTAPLRRWSFLVLHPPSGDPPASCLMNPSHEITKWERDRECEREFLHLYVDARHLAAHLHFRERVLTLNLDSTGVD